MTNQPPVLFVCLHNSRRSALAAALAQFGGRIDVGSAGVDPAGGPSDVTITSLAEAGIDDAAHVPTRITAERIAAADLVVAVKPGLDLPHIDGVRYETWSLPDPTGWDVEGIRTLRDEIRCRVDDLAIQLLSAP